MDEPPRFGMIRADRSRFFACVVGASDFIHLEREGSSNCHIHRRPALSARAMPWSNGVIVVTGTIPGSGFSVRSIGIFVRTSVPGYFHSHISAYRQAIPVFPERGLPVSV